MTIDHDKTAILAARLDEGRGHCGHCGAQDVEYNGRGQFICRACLYEVQPSYEHLLRFEAARTIRALHDEVKRLRSERDALRAHPYLPAEEIAAVESGNRRWHGEYDTTVSVRWEPYKPDGQRQMKAKGRWQTMTYNGSGYFRWENCNRPAHVREALKGDSDE